MQALLRQVEDLFDIAAAGCGSSVAIVLGRDGAFRMLDSAGWSLLALKEEFGASAVFKLERRAGRLRIEACDANERCLVERAAPASPNPARAGGTSGPFGRGPGALEVARVDPFASTTGIPAKRYAHCSQDQSLQILPQETRVYL